MRFIGLFILSMIQLLAISACGGIPIKTHPIEEDFLDKAESKSLIGEAKDGILEKYGKPDWEFEYENRRYFLYTSPGEIDLVWDIFLPYIILPGSIYDADYMYCALLEFNELEKLKNVGHTSDVYYDIHGSAVEFCMYQLFPEHDAELLIMKYEDEPKN